MNAGKITALRLIETPNEAIRSNRYALIYGVARPITRITDDQFWLDTLFCDSQAVYNDGLLVDVVPMAKAWHMDAEAYFDAFTDYDGRYLTKIESFPNAVAVKDRTQKTVYECL